MRRISATGTAGSQWIQAVTVGKEIRRSSGLQAQGLGHRDSSTADSGLKDQGCDVAPYLIRGSSGVVASA
jgi:hypothetical protein